MSKAIGYVNTLGSGPFIIDVIGMTYQGAPWPYSENPHPDNNQAGVTGETFPINLSNNTWVRAASGGGAPVIFLPTAMSRTIFQLLNTSSTGKRARLRDVILYGGSIGMSVINSGSGLVNAECINVTFSNCVTGFSGSASGGGTSSPLEVEITDCTIRDYAFIPSPPVPETGIRLNAAEASGVGRIDATISNLQTLGDFDATGLITDSTIIAVTASGESPEHPSGQTALISNVDLAILGGILEGNAKLGGWNIGVSGSSESTRTLPQDSVRDYSASYSITMSGTEVRGLGRLGVEVSTSCDARGSLTINNGSLLAETTHVGTGTGIGLFAHHLDGYLSLKLRNAVVADNESHGIALQSDFSLPMEDQSCIPLQALPEGLFIDIEATNIEGNAGDGIFALAGEHGAGPGVVGGTRYLSGSILEYFSSASWPQFPSGQGRIVRSAIQNNLGRGIRTELKNQGIASFRLVRSVLWNNLYEGWYLHFANQDAIAACPIIFCTLAGNGDLANASLRVGANSGISGKYVLDTNPSGDMLRTGFLHTIFSRKNISPGVPDFALAGGVILQEDNLALPAQYNTSFIYAVGCQSSEDPLSIAPLGFLQVHRWTSMSTPAAPLYWAGPTPNYLSPDPSEFRLNDSTGDGFGTWSDQGLVGQCTDWLGHLVLNGDHILDLNGGSIGVVEGVNFLGTNPGQAVNVNKGAFNQ